MTFDERYMAEALDLARLALGRTSPNPMVGCTIVKDGRVVGRGYHLKAGTPHAEVHALAQAGEDARGATLYITLEPCSHHGRTPPCADAVVRSGVARVVAAMSDPNPKVAGRGLSRIRQAGIEVEVGVREDEARQLNEVFVKYITTGLPFVWMKSAMTLDGKTATRTGDSKWITGEESRLEVHRLRDRLDAIMVGVGTVLADDPQLTCRLPGGRDPVRVVVDNQARTPPGAALLRSGSPAPTIIAVTAEAPAERIEALSGAGAEIVKVEREPGGRVSFPHLLRLLAARELTSVLLEGGNSLIATAVEAGLVDKAWLFVAPKTIGGREAPGPIGGLGGATMSQARHWRFSDLRRFGDDLLIEAYPADQGISDGGRH